MRSGRVWPTLAVTAALTLLTACGTTVPAARRALAPRPAVGINASDAGAVDPSSASASTNAATSAPGGATKSSARASGAAAANARASTGAGRSTGTLTIGVVYSNNGAANAALGLATDASADPQRVMEALVTGLNKHGGLAGRKLAVEYHPVDATSSDYSSQADAACATFTQDKPVAVVVDFTFGTRYGMAACLAKRGVADFGLGTTDTVADNAAGLFAAPAWMTSSRRYRAVIDGLHDSGYLAATNKIGILLEDCGYLRRAYQQSVVPEISRRRLVLADTQTVACTAGFSSAGPAAAAISSAALRLRSSGVDRVLIVSDYEQVMIMLLANHAESQGWHPGYMLSSNAQTEVVRADIASGQWPQLHGVGWSPGLDIDDPHQPLAAADQRCLDLIKEGGVSVSGWQNVYVATAECAHFLFLGAALERSAGDAQGRALMTAIGSLGAGFVSPSVVGASTFFAPDRHDGPAAAAPFGYVAACDCLRYTGPSFAVS
jgi:hypothetical protein